MEHFCRVDFEKSRIALRDILLARMPEQGNYPTAVEGFDLHRYNSGEAPKPRFYEPVIIVVVQGKKLVRIGTEDIPYGENSCFIAGINMPVASCVMEACADKPYLSMSLNLDKSLIATLAAKILPTANGTTNATSTTYTADAASTIDANCASGATDAIGATVQKLDAELLDAFLRLLELTKNADQAMILGPLLYQEIHYRLLNSPFGDRLRALNTLGSQSNQITRAVSWLQEHYKESLHVEKLAERLNMATSTFHRHFKEITTLSPLQYQKHIRLSEAQRLMLAADFDATQAAFAVGYESATQFNREYKRLFGESPRKDVMKIRGMGSSPQMAAR